MSYTQVCARAPIAKILEAGLAHPDWDISVSEDSGEVWLSYIPEGKDGHRGSYCFGWIDVNETPDHITTSVACYGCPDSDDELRTLIRSAKLL